MPPKPKKRLGRSSGNILMATMSKTPYPMHFNRNRSGTTSPPSSSPPPANDLPSNVSLTRLGRKPEAPPPRMEQEQEEEEEEHADVGEGEDDEEEEEEENDYEGDYEEGNYYANEGGTNRRSGKKRANKWTDTGKITAPKQKFIDPLDAAVKRRLETIYTLINERRDRPRAADSDSEEEPICDDVKEEEGERDLHLELLPRSRLIREAAEFENPLAEPPEQSAVDETGTDHEVFVVKCLTDIMRNQHELRKEQLAIKRTLALQNLAHLHTLEVVTTSRALAAKEGIDEKTKRVIDKCAQVLTLRTDADLRMLPFASTDDMDHFLRSQRRTRKLATFALTYTPVNNRWNSAVVSLLVHPLLKQKVNWSRARNMPDCLYLPKSFELFLTYLTKIAWEEANYQMPFNMDKWQSNIRRAFHNTDTVDECGRIAFKRKHSKRNANSPDDGGDHRKLNADDGDSQPPPPPPAGAGQTGDESQSQSPPQDGSSFVDDPNRFASTEVQSESVIMSSQ